MKTYILHCDWFETEEPDEISIPKELGLSAEEWLGMEPVERLTLVEGFAAGFISFPSGQTTDYKLSGSELLR